MSEHVLATTADGDEQRRMALLFAFHGPLTIEALEAAGLAVRPDVMKAAGVDVVLGPKVAGLLEDAGAVVEQVRSRPARTREDDRVAAEISAITIERFRGRTGLPDEAIDAALAALRDPGRRFTGPTRWVIRARVA